MFDIDKDGIINPNDLVSWLEAVPTNSILGAELNIIKRDVIRN